MQVHAARGDQQGAAPGLSAPFPFAEFVRDDVGAYEGVVLTAQGACAELAWGGPLDGRGREGAFVPWVEPASSGAGGDEVEQRCEETGDEAGHG